MEVDVEEPNFERFITDVKAPELDTKRTIKILLEIKGLKE
jgi:hypothetical protein